MYEIEYPFPAFEDAFIATVQVPVLAIESSPRLQSAAVREKLRVACTVVVTWTPAVNTNTATPSISTALEHPASL